MPYVNVKMLEGRTSEQKRELVKALTDVMVEMAGARREGTTVIIDEYPRDHWATNGIMVADRPKT